MDFTEVSKLKAERSAAGFVEVMLAIPKTKFHSSLGKRSVRVMTRRWKHRKGHGVGGG